MTPPISEPVESKDVPQLSPDEDTHMQDIVDEDHVVSNENRAVKDSSAVSSSHIILFNL